MASRINDNLQRSTTHPDVDDTADGYYRYFLNHLELNKDLSGTLNATQNTPAPIKDASCASALTIDAAALQMARPFASQLSQRYLTTTPQSDAAGSKNGGSKKKKKESQLSKYVKAVSSTSINYNKACESHILQKEREQNHN